MSGLGWLPHSNMPLGGLAKAVIGMVSCTAINGDFDDMFIAKPQRRYHS
jgi:hypothetical protein